MDTFRNVFITHVDKAGPILKLWAQLDRETPTLIERTINQLTEQFNVGIGLPDPSALEVGKLVCAKYSDGVYYRARILSLANLTKAEVCVQFADYGNFETIDVINLRVLEGFASSLSSAPDQAIDLYLAGIVSPGTEWCSSSLKFVKDTICYVELKCQFVGQVVNKRFIKLFYENMDFVDCLMERSIGYSVLLELQKTILANYLARKSPQPHHPMFPNYNPEIPPPHGAMMTPHMHRPNDIALQESVHRALQARQENMIQKIPNVLPPPGYSGYPHPGSTYALSGLLPPSALPPPRAAPLAPEQANSGSFVNTVLKPGTQYEVRVTAVTDGPYAFCITLKEMESTLHKLLITINSTPPTPLMTFPMVGTRCFARSTQGKNLCRAVIKNIVHDACTVYYVDYGNSEDIPLSDVYEIPSNYVGQPPVMALQFTHGGLGTLEVTKDIKDMFKKYTSGKLFSLFVIPTESHAMEQYGILYENKRGVIDIILDKIEARNSMSFSHLPPIAVGSNKMVVVSFVENVNKFFVQLEDNLPTIESLMNELMLHCKNNASPIGLTDLRAKLLCCAKFHADEQWYRAEVTQVTPEGIFVNYVDFGNTEQVQLNSLMTITPELVTCLPVQAVECALVDYLKASLNDAMINEFVALTDSRSLVMKVMSQCKNGSLAVHLTDVSNTLPVLIGSALEKFQQPTKDTPPAKAESKAEERGVYRAPTGSLAPEVTSHGAGDGKYQRQVSRAEASSDWRAKDGCDSKWRGDTSAPRVFTPASVSVGDVKAAQLVFVESPDCFYLQLTPDMALTDVMADIADKYESGSSKPLRPATAGAACVARFADDATWYRAIVRSVAQGKARVHFVDYGNEDEVPLDDVREIDGAFMQFPSQGIKCALASAVPSSGAWSDAEIEKFTNLADGKPLEVRFVAERGDAFVVTVKDAETDTIVNKAFGPQDLVAKARPSYEDAKPKSSYEKPKSTYDDKPRNSYDDKPRNSYDDKPRNSYDDKPRNSYDDKPRNSYDDKPRNSYDDKPRNSRDDKPKGNYDEKPRGSYDDKPRNNWDDKPKPSYDDKPKPSYDDKPKPPARPPQVFASRDERYVCEEFVPADTEDVCVSWFISPGQFFVQRLSKCDQMEKMMRDIQAAYRSTSSNGSQLAVGVPCIAKYLADGSLCRAEVMSREGATYIVRYVDFGNRDRLSAADMWQVESKFLHLPRQAVECELAGVKPPGGEAWPKSTDDTAKMFEREKYECVFHEPDEAGKYRVTLTHDGASVADELVSAGLAAAPPVPAPPVPEEPVARQLLTGQTLKAAGIYVEGVARFFVHLENNRAAEVQAQVDEWVQQPENLSALYPASDVSIGRLCLATADSIWYRARIVDPTGILGVGVVFVDYGDGDEITPDSMVVIPDWLATLPGQAMECSLSGCDAVSVDAEVEDKFKADLEGESVIIHVEAVTEDGILKVGVYGMDGVKLALVAHMVTGADSVSALLPAPVLTQKSRVFVSATEGDNSVWLQRADDADAIADLLTLLYTYYQEENKGEAVSPAVDLVCAAKSAADEQWYRSRVTAITDTGVTVQYVDYGNSETVPADNLKTLDATFLATHCAALAVVLPVVNESAVVVDLPTITAEVEYVAVFARGPGDSWLAELFCKREALSDVLQELGMDIIADYPFTSACEELCRSPPLVSGEIVSMFTSHTVSPAEVWLQRASDAADIELLQADLQTAADIMLPAEAEVDTVCAALFSEDSAWYRATVLAVDGTSATVRFLDYGNTDIVDIATNPLKQLTPRLAKIQHFALRCRLNVLPRGDEFGETAVARLAELLAATADAISCEVLSVDEEICIDLTVAGKSVSRTLIDEGLVDEKVPVDAVFVSHAETPAEFWIQHLANSSKLNMMVEQLIAAAEFEPLVEPAEGSLCAAQFTDDEQWYRARVLGTTDDGTRVLFVDYGNSAVSTEVRVLPESLAAQPILALRCTLGDHAWSEKQAAKFLEMSAEGAMLFTVAVIKEGDLMLVKLSDDVGQDVGEALAVLAPAASLTHVEAKDVSKPATEQKETVVNVGETVESVETVIVEEETVVEEQELAINNEDAVEKKEKVIDNEEMLEKEEVAFDHEEVLEKEEVAFDNEDAVQKEEMVIDNEEMVNDNEEMVIDNEEMLKKEEVAFDHEEVLEMEEVAFDNDEMLEKEEVAFDNEEILEKEEVAFDNEEAVESEGMAIDNDQAVEKEEIAIKDEETVGNTEMPIENKAVTVETEETDAQGEIEPEVKTVPATPIRSAPVSRPNTPYEERIVPGSVCRGVSEEELLKYSSMDDEPIALEEIPEDQSRSCPATPVPRPRSYSPVFLVLAPKRLLHNERIVPGCISSGSSSEELNPVKGTPVVKEEVLSKSLEEDEASVNSNVSCDAAVKPTSDDDQASFKSTENEEGSANKSTDDDEAFQVPNEASDGEEILKATAKAIYDEEKDAPSDVKADEPAEGSNVILAEVRSDMAAAVNGRKDIG